MLGHAFRERGSVESGLNLGMCFRVQLLQGSRLGAKPCLRLAATFHYLRLDAQPRIKVVKRSSTTHPHMMFTACLALALPKPERSNRSSGLMRDTCSYLLNKQMIIDNRWLGLANAQDERFTHFFCYQDQRERLLTFGLGIIILQGVSSRKSLAG
jgi:hypothetical protein